MKIAVARESFPGEQRVALIPASIPSLMKAGLNVVVESTAGESAGFVDDAYRAAGAQVVASRDEVFDADVILQVRACGANPDAGREDIGRIGENKLLIAMCDPLGNPNAAQEVAASHATVMALELIPRITRAQSMDVLSSMATIAGYRAVLLGAIELPKMFPLMMTAAGTLTPARVFVIGVGVAGLQAIATARRLGAVVRAYDVRPAVRDQVESLGAKFVELELETSDAEAKGGYARELGDEFYKKQRELMASVVAESDLVVTTAAIPGKRSPLLVTNEAVSGMQPRSVIVDLAAERGGNCEPSEPDQRVVHDGIVILGPTNLPSEIPNHASQMYSKNISTFLLNLIQDGQLRYDMEDEIISDTMIARGGEVVHPRLRESLGLPELQSATSGHEEDASRGSESASSTEEQPN